MIRVLLTEQQEVDLELLAERCHVESVDIVLGLSISLLDWAVAEKENGREVASATITGAEAKLLRMTLLDAIAPLLPTVPQPQLKLIRGDRWD